MLFLAKLDKSGSTSSASVVLDSADDVGIKEIIWAVVVQAVAMIKNVILFCKNIYSADAHDYTYDVYVCVRITYDQERACFIECIHDVSACEKT